MKKAIHLIPYDGTGGVEVAARSVQCPDQCDLDFLVQTIYSHVPGYHERGDTFDLRPLFAAYARVRRERPDLLIVSLWRACIVGFLLKLFHPSMRLALMLHSTKDAHLADGMITAATACVADELWGDSAATVNQRVRSFRHKTRRVISFVTRSVDPLPAGKLMPSFVFWGRISPPKRIERAILLFSEIHRTRAGAKFTVIGPDGGVLARLRRLVAKLKLENAISFTGEMTMEQIRQEAAGAAFYLQTSHYEGMAMSVVEAMQMGLVPVVTPVGEIGAYCRNGKNSVLIHSIEEGVVEVNRLLSDPERYSEMRADAIRTWAGKPLYATSILNACRSALGLPERVQA